MKRYSVAFAVIFVVFLLIIAGFYKVMFDLQLKRNKAAAAEATANKRALEAADTYTQKTVVIREKGNVITQRIYERPDADSPVPADVLSAWRDGIDGLRNSDAKSADPASVP